MKRTYKLFGADEPEPVALEATGEDSYRVTVGADGAPADLHVREIRDGLVLLSRSDGAVQEIPYVRDGVTITLSVHGRVYSFDVLDETQAVLREQRAGAAGGDGLLKVAMPGRVIAIEVAEGEHVAAGQGVVIVEAMKMENELKAPVAGTVARIAVEVGGVVEAGDLLLQITPDEA